MGACGRREDPAAQPASECFCGKVRAHRPDRGHRPDGRLRSAASADDPGRVRGPLQRTTTPIAVGTSARPGQITLSRTCPGSASSTGPSSAASSTNMSGPHRSPGQDWWPSSETPQGDRQRHVRPGLDFDEHAVTVVGGRQQVGIVGAVPAGEGVADGGGLLAEPDDLRCPVQRPDQGSSVRDSLGQGFIRHLPCQFHGYPRPGSVAISRLTLRVDRRARRGGSAPAGPFGVGQYPG
jgi:hypothetical protein